MSPRLEVFWLVEIRLGDPNVWTMCQPKFTTEAEAHEYGLQLYKTWNLVKQWRVVKLERPAPKEGT